MEVFKNACADAKKDLKKVQKKTKSKVKFTVVDKEELERRRIPVYPFIM